MADKKSKNKLNIKRKRLKNKLSISPLEKTKININQNILSYNEDFSHEEDFLEKEIEEGRQENSLCQLTKKVIQYIKNKKKLNININELVRDLGVKKRRIYDITNVLQGIGYIEKKGKNEIIWIKKQIFNKKDIKIKNNQIKIYKQLNEMNDLINNAKDELISISSKKEFNKYGYITFTDLKNLSKDENLDLIIIKANIGTKVEIMDKKNSRKTCEEIMRQFQDGKIELNQKNYKKINLIKNENHIFFDSNEPKAIKIYRINNGELNEIIKDANKGVYYFVNKDIELKKDNNIINKKENENKYESNMSLELNLNFNEIIVNKKDSENNNKDEIKFPELKEINIDLEKHKSSINEINSNKRFSIYDFLKWSKDSYSQNYNEIKNKYCGISSLFQNQIV